MHPATHASAAIHADPSVIGAAGLVVVFAVYGLLFSRDPRSKSKSARIFYLVAGVVGLSLVVHLTHGGAS